MKKITLALLCSLFLFSCSSDSSDSSSSGTQIKRIEEHQNGILIKSTDYQYNQLGNITKMVVNDQSKIYETTFNYDSNNKMITWDLKEYYIFDPSMKIEQTNTLEYDNGRIADICIDRVDNTFDDPYYASDRILYSYDSGVYPTSIMHYSASYYNLGEDHSCDDVIYEDNEETFEYTNGNATYYSSGSDGFFNNYNTIEYDNKHNPLAMIKPDAFKNAIGRSSVNNMSKVMVYNSDDDTLDGTATFENTYNGNDFLIKAIERYYPAGISTPSVTTTMTYFYY